IAQLRCSDCNLISIPINIAQLRCSDCNLISIPINILQLRCSDSSNIAQLSCSITFYHVFKK
ncbi:MAG: hypothetical protein WCR42_04505, partial [bacterium]